MLRLFQCKNNADHFCYVCGKYTITKNRKNITNDIIMLYESYFRTPLLDQDKTWAPHQICKCCISELRNWYSLRKSSMPFGYPMVWREPVNHQTDCYFCLVFFTKPIKMHSSAVYPPTMNSAIHPRPHDSLMPVPTSPKFFDMPNNDNMDYDMDSNQPTDDWSTTTDTKLNQDLLYESCSGLTRPYTQAELNDLVKDKKWTKTEAQEMASEFKSRNFLCDDVHYSWYRNRHLEYVDYFIENEEKEITFCSDIDGLMKAFNHQFKSDQWRLFVDGSSKSLKAVLLHNENLFPSIPLAYSTNLKENFNSMELILNNLQWYKYDWNYVADLKVVGLLCGLQPGNIKHCCFLCDFDNRDKNRWNKVEWPARNYKDANGKNMEVFPIIDPTKIILPPLHIKLGCMTQFIKILPKDGRAMKYLMSKFHKLSANRINSGVFNGPQIRKLLNDNNFINILNLDQRNAWIAFKNLTENFFGNYKSPNYELLVDEMLHSFEKLGCSLTLKLHFLKSHLDRFASNLGQYSEEQGERFHQDLRDIELRYDGKSQLNMLADYCWSLTRETDNPKRKLPFFRK